MSNRLGGHDSQRGPGSGSSPSGRGADARTDDADVPAPGDVVAGKYRVDGVLGVGGMGVVVAARHIQLGQRVAIKFMRATSNDAASIERFFREARAVVGLSSEHVAKVLDMGTLETGAPYIVMEFLAGIDMGEALRRHGPMPVAAAVGSILQACEAIAEAHSIGIVHRDLKPANLFLTTQIDGASFVKVLDFGISKMARSEAHHDLTASGAIMGSPGYMSPEQVRNSKDIDLRSDIWAVGVILYELLGGVNPFQGDTLGEVFAKIVSESPAPLARLRQDVPASLSATIARCLEREPARRFANLGELASMLLPHAPAEATLSVRRILRICGTGQSAPRFETLAAPSSTQSDSQGSGRIADGSAGRVESGPAWLRSNASAPQSRRSRGLFVTVAVGVVLASGVTWLYVAQRSRVDASGGANPASSAPIAAPGSLPPAVSASLPATLAGDPRAGANASAAVPAPVPEHDLVAPVENEGDHRDSSLAASAASAPPAATNHASSGHAGPAVLRPRPIAPAAVPPPRPPAISAPHPAPTTAPHETDVF
jgi:eukaryotic-like serine/threonine-protein kinase